MFLDLDDFKQGNDTLGHRTGDKLLAEIARRLKVVVASSDLVARWGGDEFVILHYDGPGWPGTATLAKRIIDEVSRPVVIDGSEVIVGASIGSASAPDDGLSADTLLSNADIALYAAKADGRRGWRAFEPAMDTKIQIRRLGRARTPGGGGDRCDRCPLPADPRRLQPPDRRISRRSPAGASLARRRVASRIHPHPRGHRAHRGARRKRAEAGLRDLRFLARRDDRVGQSIPSQFRNGNIERTINEALRAANLAPDRLDIEITKSTLLDDRGGDTRRTLEALRERGVRISLDDFGTGYSSPWQACR